MKKYFWSIFLLPAAVLLISACGYGSEVMQGDLGAAGNEAPARYNDTPLPDLPLQTTTAADADRGTPGIRLSEDLYIEPAPTGNWTPFFTGDEPVWSYNPQKPWADRWSADSFSWNQWPGIEAYTSLYTFFRTHPNFAGGYVNIEGFLTVMMVNPTDETAQEIGELSPYPVWIIEAEFPRRLLYRAQREVVDILNEWIKNNPDVSVSWSSIGVATIENRVSVPLSGSGAPVLIAAMDFPDYVEFIVSHTFDPSAVHEIPRSPVSVWERAGVTVKSARESYPIGTDFLLITAFHEVEGMRLFAPYSPLTVEKYVDGEWINVSGDFSVFAMYTEIFDIPAGHEKTVQIGIITPETLGPGLYRAIYRGSFRLARSGMYLGWDGDYISVSSPDDKIVLEFIITPDAEPLPPREFAGW